MSEKRPNTEKNRKKASIKEQSKKNFVLKKGNY